MKNRVLNWLRMHLPVTKHAFLLELEWALDRREAKYNAKLDALLAAVADGSARGASIAERGAAAAERGAAAAERGAAAAEQGAAAAERGAVSAERGANTAGLVLGGIQQDLMVQSQISSRVSHLVRRIEERLAQDIGEAALDENIGRMLSLPKDAALPVVFIADSNYIRPTCVAISSLIRHRDPATRYDIHVVGVDLCERDRTVLGAFGEAVHVICPANKYAAFQTNHLHVSKAALFKFDLADLLPDHDRVLYLDSDVLVLRDLRGLREVDLASAYAAAVKDYAGMELGRHHERLGLPLYFNSGVMLLNLALIRQKEMHEGLLRAKEETDRRFPGMFMDQDAFNFAFAGNVACLGPEYNFMYSNNIRVGARPATAKFYGISPRDYLRAESKPAIVHLTNEIKPWDSALADLYELYVEEMAWFARACGGAFE